MRSFIVNDDGSRTVAPCDIAGHQVLNSWCGTCSHHNYAHTKDRLCTVCQLDIDVRAHHGLIDG